MGASKVILTDLPEALALQRRNASTSNFAAAVDIRSLKWGEPFDYEAFDLVLACDCIYQPECYEAFAATITALDAPALIAWRPRGRREEEALRLIAASGFSIVDESRQPVDPEVRIIWATPPRLVMPCGLPLSVSCAGLVTSDPHMLQPDIIEAVGEAVSTAADELVALEQHTAGHTDASWMAQASIQSWHQEAQSQGVPGSWLLLVAPGSSWQILAAPASQILAAMATRSWLSDLCYETPSTRSWVPVSICHTTSRLPDDAYQMLPTRCCLRPGFQILATTSWLAGPGYQIPVTRTWLRDSGYQMLDSRFCLPRLFYRILASRSWLPDAGFQILASRSWLPDRSFSFSNLNSLPVWGSRAWVL